MRVKRGIVRHRRHKKIRKLARGFMDQNHTTFKKANEAVLKAGRHSFRDRRKKKRDFRSLWITRLNAALRAKGVRYSVFIAGLSKQKIALNRKTLSELAIHEPQAFEAVVKAVMK
jgi:large subunit ribosomal protein L20